MAEKIKVVYYINQFFGQIGGEEQASTPVMVKEGKIGPAIGFEALLNGEGAVVTTIICGDNFFNENTAVAKAEILSAVKEVNPDLFVAGPAFNAGRYGMACAEISKAVHQELGISVVSGMYIENPGVDVCKDVAYVVSTGESAADMKKALPLMATLALKLAKGEEIGSPKELSYFPRGMRKTMFAEKRGSLRAMDMLKARLNDQPYETEMPMPTFDIVPPAPAIKELSKAKIALCTSGGVVPQGNPDRIESASAQKWGKYNVDDKETLESTYFYTTHGGYDPVYCNELPGRVVPLDILNEFKKEGYIGEVYSYFYTTTGTGTSVGNSVTFGREIGAELKAAGVDGVILTST